VDLEGDAVYNGKNCEMLVGFSPPPRGDYTRGDSHKNTVRFSGGSSIPIGSCAIYMGWRKTGKKIPQRIFVRADVKMWISS